MPSDFVRKPPNQCKRQKVAAVPAAAAAEEPPFVPAFCVPTKPSLGIFDPTPFGSLLCKICNKGVKCTERRVYRHMKEHWKDCSVGKIAERREFIAKALADSDRMKESSAELKKAKKDNEEYPFGCICECGFRSKVKKIFNQHIQKKTVNCNPENLKRETLFGTIYGRLVTSDELKTSKEREIALNQQTPPVKPDVDQRNDDLQTEREICGRLVTSDELKTSKAKEVTLNQQTPSVKPDFYQKNDDLQTEREIKYFTRAEALLATCSMFYLREHSSD